MTTETASFSVKWDQPLPKNWTMVQLSSIASVFDCKHRTPTYQLAGYPVVRTGDVKEGDLDLSKSPRCSLEEYEDLVENYRPKRGDIVYSRNASFGVAAFAETDELFTIGQDVVIITSDSACNRYLFYVLNSEAFKRCLNRLSAGSTFQRINLDDIRRYGIPLPPIDEQTKLVQILKSFDDVIKNTLGVIDQTRQFKNALLQNLFVNGVSRKRCKPQVHRSLGRMPSHWSAQPLSHLVAREKPITYGIVQAGPNLPGGVPYIRVSDMASRELSANEMLRTSKEIAKSYQRSTVSAGDTVIALRGDVGVAHVVPPELTGANLTQGTARISPGPEVTSRFLLWGMRSHGVRTIVKKNSKGSTFKEISLAALETIDFPVPP